MEGAGKEWKELEGAGSSWQWLAGAGRRLKGVGRDWKGLEGLERFGRGCKGLERVGKGWQGLEAVGRGWQGLERAGRDWRGLAGAVPVPAAPGPPPGGSQSRYYRSGKPKGKKIFPVPLGLGWVRARARLISGARLHGANLLICRAALPGCVRAVPGAGAEPGPVGIRSLGCPGAAPAGG